MHLINYMKNKKFLKNDIQFQENIQNINVEKENIQNNIEENDSTVVVLDLKQFDDQQKTNEAKVSELKLENNNLRNFFLKSMEEASQKHIESESKLLKQIEDLKKKNLELQQYKESFVNNNKDAIALIVNEKIQEIKENTQEVSNKKDEIIADLENQLYTLEIVESVNGKLKVIEHNMNEMKKLITENTMKVKTTLGSIIKNVDLSGPLEFVLESIQKSDQGLTENLKQLNNWNVNHIYMNVNKKV